jgi:arabinogalactan endo-1,4-beta-galactosidase
MKKLQAPTSQLQRKSKHQALITAWRALDVWRLVFLWSLVLGCGSFSSRAADFAFGADLSFLKQAEDRGKIFKDGTNALPGLQLFRNHGYNWVRLRLFVEPVSNNLPNNLAYTLALAQDAKQLGYKFLLDFHYANSWADPGKQPTPGAWMDLSHKQRVQKVFEHTRDTLAAFREAGVTPEMVQIGNEVRSGILWPDGKLPEHWDNFADYLRAGIKGVAAGCGTNSPPKIMIHFDQGGSSAKTKYFFDRLNHYGISYDIIGFSYYPWWHGTLMDLRENLAFTAKAYDKDVIVVETAYYWKPNRETADRVGPFPETPEGQRAFLDELTRVVLAVPGGRGQGVFWWEPAVGNRGGLGARSFFDENGNSLPILSVFDKYTRPAPKKSGE